MPTSNQVPLPECEVRFASDDGGIGAAMTVKMIAHNENKMMDSLYMMMRGGWSSTRTYLESTIYRVLYRWGQAFTSHQTCS